MRDEDLYEIPNIMKSLLLCVDENLGPDRNKSIGLGHSFLAIDLSACLTSLRESKSYPATILSSWL